MKIAKLHLENVVKRVTKATALIVKKRVLNKVQSDLEKMKDDLTRKIDELEYTLDDDEKGF